MTADSASEGEGGVAEGAEVSFRQNEESSEEEVFEGYVDDDDLVGGRGRWEELEEEGEVGRKEVPLYVLRELKDVLTVRNSERDKRRMRRRGDRAGKRSLDQQRDVSCDNSLQSRDMPVLSHDMPMQSHDRQPAIHTPSGLPLPQIDISANTSPLSSELAAAIRNRRVDQNEDIFS